MIDDDPAGAARGWGEALAGGLGEEDELVVGLVRSGRRLAEIALRLRIEPAAARERLRELYPRLSPETRAAVIELLLPEDGAERLSGA